MVKDARAPVVSTVPELGSAQVGLVKSTSATAGGFSIVPPDSHSALVMSPSRPWIRSGFAEPALCRTPPQVVSLFHVLFGVLRCARCAWYLFESASTLPSPPRPLPPPLPRPPPPPPSPPPPLPPLPPPPPAPPPPTTPAPRPPPPPPARPP